MSECVVKLPHQKCGSSDALQVFKNDGDTYSGYCFSCHTYVPDPLGDNPDLSSLPKTRPKKSQEEIQEEINEISKLPSLDLEDRGLLSGALEFFGVKVGYSEYDGKTPAYVHFPRTKDGVVQSYKTRTLGPEKRMWSNNLTKELDPFGWTQALASGARRLIITEGEFDAIALTKILKSHTPPEFKKNIPAVISVNNGAAAAFAEIVRFMPEMRKHFKEISLCFDQDEAGKEAVDRICARYPGIKVIHLPGKDANHCLVNGLGQAAYKATTFNAQENKNTKLVWGRDVAEKAKEPPEWGLSWPWEGMTQLTRGIRGGETIYIGAAEKMGKSEVLNAVAAHLMLVHGKKVFMAKPEEANVKTHKLLCSKVAGKIFHDPKIPFDLQAYEEASSKIQDSYCMLDLYQNISWNTLKGDLYAAVDAGIWGAFIDPITNFTNGLSATEANEFLQGFAQDAAVLAKDLDIPIFLFCHLNKPSKGNTPFDRGGKVTTDYFAGSSAMARSCNYAIAIEGNKDDELPPEERNRRDLVILADREYGEVGRVKLYWDYKTGLFNEVKG